MGENDHNVPPVAARRDAAIWSYRDAKLKSACRGHALVGEVWSAFEVSVSRVDKRHGMSAAGPAMMSRFRLLMGLFLVVG